MIYPIVRMYETSQQAEAAANKLREWGFREDLINVVTPALPSGDFAAAIMAGYVLKRDALVYAEGVRRGRSLVSVRAPFGKGRVAIDVLDRLGPVDSGVPDEPADHLPGWDDAAPFSSAFWMPTKARDATPFSSFWVLPVVTRKGRTLGERLGLPEVSNSSAPIQTSLGMPLLSRKVAPLSELLKLPLLK